MSGERRPNGRSGIDKQAGGTPGNGETAWVARGALSRSGSRKSTAPKKRADSALNKRSERLQLLSDSLAQLLAARDQDTLVRELLPKVAAHLGAEAYFDFLLDAEGNGPVLHVCVGIPEDGARAIQRLEFGQEIGRTVARTRRAIHASDPQHADFDRAELMRCLGIRCYACNPLIVGDRLLGTLSFASRMRTGFDDDELQFLEIVSQHTAVALDRLQSAEKLRESEERFKAVLDNSIAVIYVKDCEGRYLLINDQYSKLFHTTEEALIGRTDFDLFPAEAARKFRAADLEVIRRGEPIEIEEVAPHDDGPHTYISIKFPLRKADGSIYAVAGISTDITERKKAQESMARLAAIVEHSDDAIISKDLNGIIKTWNRAAERLFGYTAQEAIGQSVHLIIPESCRNEEPAILDPVRQGQIIDHFETVRQRKCGTLVNVSLTVSPIRDAQGNVVGVSTIARDITERVRAKEKLEQTVAERTAQLRDLVAELEAFSYSVAHDMRAPLRSMRSYSRFLEQDYAHLLPQEAQDFIRRIAASAGRLDALITDVLNYSKIARGELTLEAVDVEKLTREIVDSYPDLRDSGAAILVQSPIPPVIGNAAALTQCISNLLANAIKFVSPGKKPQVLVRAEKSSGFVRVWVEDNGIGISEEGRKRIFRMFQRLNPSSEFEGTGIGLTIVRKAVERMGGRVGLESELGAGSRFWIELRSAS